jgi:hypothetical protein
MGADQGVDVAGVRNNLELSDALRALLGQLNAAGQSDAEALIAAAIRETNMPVPSKWTLLDLLEDAADDLEDSGSSAKFRSSIEQAIEVVKTRL